MAGSIPILSAVPLHNKPDISHALPPQSSTGKSTSHVAGPTWALGRSALSESVSGLSVHSGHSVDLLDLQLEIENIEQGISQVSDGEWEVRDGEWVDLAMKRLRS